MPKKIAPWDDDLVDRLNEYQRNGSFHGYTCGGDRTDFEHTVFAESNSLRDRGLLTATRNGWVCPVCGFTQDWCFSKE